MPDRRSVDDLTIEELEQILRVKKHQARQDRLRRLQEVGRRPPGVSPIDAPEASEEGTSESESEAPDPYDQIAHESFLYGVSSAGWKERSLRDKLLLAVEFAAAIGLVAILVYAAISLQNINREAESAQVAQLIDLPTPTVTPIISAVVLPGGHTPPTDPDGAQPNYDEVPQYLRPLVEQQFNGPVIVLTASPGVALRIQIPAIEVDAPVVQGDGWEQLRKGVAQHLGTANPGESGNVVLSGHNDIYGEIFRHLDQLEEGDEIILSTQTEKFTYRVSYWHSVPPAQVDVMAPSNDAIVTLISCYPYLIDTDRYVVIGELVK